ncbi:hypothetical protein GCK72_000827 [Caenorhabditis remanei]|uniref:C-type lectin domain-containing protein n=1 Tax=Caenorhabditis remanei TaxID=31234 RepID=A0A6A5HQW9_CAERE|nr:hypothetical protein GCK72_000827 [Caenorhabditis remanei]KAF1769014.1 hypothetical protein GCK72_000827 [Caenorhabditis remanei]
MSNRLLPINFNQTSQQKNRGKRAIEIRMMKIIVLFCLLSVCSAEKEGFSAYYPLYEKEDIDHSALQYCYVFQGTIKPVDVNNVQKGYKCEASSSTWVKDDSHAMDFCTSRIPYHIIKASVNPKGGTFCTFQINLKCEIGWFQMRNKCYKVFAAAKNYTEAEDYCLQHKPEFKTRIAEYYDGHLSTYIGDLIFNDAWVSAPEMEELHAGKGLKPILIMNGAYKYDSRKGVVLMIKPELKREVICEYSPPMTMAEMYLMAELYSEVYPIHVTTNGASFATSSYMTIEQTDLRENRKGKLAETFDTKNIRERCQAIGNILSVDSHPMASIQEEFDTVKSQLTDHRFHLTSAYKNDGCEKTTYKDWDFATDTLLSVYSTVHQTSNAFCKAFSFSFHPKARLPSMAAMRAPALCSLHSFSYEYDDCEPGWITAYRSKTTKFCHYIYTEKQVTLSEAKRACLNMNAALTGFENEEEFKYVQKEFGQGKPGYGDHFWLGGTVPCKEDCTDPIYKASWDSGVSRNTHFLNYFNHIGYDWRDDCGEDSISFRSDVVAFHTHYSNDEYFSHMMYICGKYPKLSVKKMDIKNVKQG